jgi:hypothetical protein
MISSLSGKRKSLSRRDGLKIAQRFNVGYEPPDDFSPEGTIELCRPFGTGEGFIDPALPLKRWAIVGCPFGTKAESCRSISNTITRKSGRGLPPSMTLARGFGALDECDSFWSAAVLCRFYSRSRTLV